MSIPGAISPDVITILTNAVIGLAAIGAAAGGIFVGLRKIRNGAVEAGGEQKKLIGVSLMENTTLLMWSESNKEVCETNRDLTREIVELRHMLDRLRDKL